MHTDALRAARSCTELHRAAQSHSEPLRATQSHSARSHLELELTVFEIATQHRMAWVFPDGFIHRRDEHVALPRVLLLPFRIKQLLLLRHLMSEAIRRTQQTAPLAASPNERGNQTHSDTPRGTQRSTVQRHPNWECLDLQAPRCLHGELPHVALAFPGLHRLES